MRIYVTSVFVDDQAKALSFYTDTLGFIAKNDVPVGDHRWLTVVSQEDPGGTELLLEPSQHPAVKPFKDALVKDGIPATSFQVQDLNAEFARLRERGVVFRLEPMDAGPVRMAVLDDTCGNLIQLIKMKRANGSAVSGRSEGSRSALIPKAWDRRHENSSRLPLAAFGCDCAGMPAHARSLRLGLLALALFGVGWASDAHGQASSALRTAPDAAPALYGPGAVYARIPAQDEYGRDQLAMFRAWNPDPVGNHEANLRAIQPALARVVRRAQAENPGLRFVIGSGRRDRKLQRRAVAWGWSRTHASSHRSGLAVDLWPLDAEGRVIFDPNTQNRIAVALKRAATELGVSLRWGGRFRGYKHMDRSHFELLSR